TLSPTRRYCRSTTSRFMRRRLFTCRIAIRSNDTKQNIAERTPTRQEAGLPEKGCVFCCFNNNWKITPEVFSVWIRLLHAVEGSVLWLFRADRLDRRDHGCPFAPRPALAAATGADHDRHLSRAGPCGVPPCLRRTRRRL